MTDPPAEGQQPVPWGLEWILLVLTGGEKRHVLSVDPYAHVTWRKA